MSDLAIATQLVHAGERRAAPVGVPAATPIYATSTFIYERMEDVDRVVEGETSGFVYSRYGNPTTSALEEAMAAIENGKFAFSIGNNSTIDFSPPAAKCPINIPPHSNG